MKKYLTIAAVLGAIAFVSVSFLAQATEPAAAVSTTVETNAAAPAAEATTTTTVAADATKECEASVAASFEGKTPSDEEKAAAVKACVDAKATADTQVDVKVAE